MTKEYYGFKYDTELKIASKIRQNTQASKAMIPTDIANL